MSKLQELIAEKARLESEISALISASRKEAIDKVRALIQEFDLTAEEIGRTGTSSRSARKSGGASKAGTKVQPKYRDPETGATWSGRGVAPRWIAGKDRDAFLIQ
ncbi:MAG: H-NS family nucleoid-associated regulatory protein [Pseudomonadales bacterium]